MANSKISALTSATTPLAGTETLPVVQSSTTKQVSVANLTAGRAVSTAALTATGPLTAGANAAYTHTFKQNNDTAIVIYSDAASQVTLESVQASNSANKYDFYFSKYGGNSLFGGNVTLANGNLVQGTAAKGVTTGGAFSLGLGTNGSTTQASLDTSGNLKVGSGSALTKLDVAGSIAPTNAPSSNWGLDFAPSTSSGTYITIANNGTYDLAVGSGMVFLLDQNGNGFGQLASYYGNTYIVWQSGTLYTTTSGTANKVNFFYNAGTGKYRVENKFGISLDLWVSTIKMRNVS